MNRQSPRPMARANRDMYAEYKRLLWLRSQGRCERPQCGQTAHDPHHARKPRRSYHYSIVALCRSCHEWVDAPITSRRGRLRIVLEEYSEGDPVVVFTFSIHGGPQDGWEKYVVLPALVRG